MKHLVVLNGNAGTMTENLENEAKEAFEGLDFEIYKTTGPRSVIPFLKEYLKKHAKETVRVYACGGDGTVFEVANGMVGFENAELAIYPVGTGNDFIKIYGEKEKFMNFKTLIEAKAFPIDLSKISSPNTEDLYSVNVINFGFDAIVGAMGNYYKENGLPEEAKKKGMDPYDYALKHDAMKHGRFNNIIVYADGEQLNERQMLLCTLAQGQFVGGKFHCAPKSDNTDGLIDVCLLKTMTFLGLGMIIGTYTKGKHLNKKRKKIVYRRAKEIKMVGLKDFDVCIDGEMIKGNNFVVSVCPSALKLAIPE